MIVPRCFVLVSLFFLALTGCTGTPVAANDDASCDRTLAPITSGPGADGPYAMKTVSVRNPSFRRKSVLVFLPEGASGKRPVIFFSHGYGPNRWQSYADLIRHVVSRGYILVYSTYPALFADNGERYKALRTGFEAAVQETGQHMDLSRVGFVGHSFGGGATPAMAFAGLVTNGWGGNGAFMMEMAPWYVYGISPGQWRKFPKSVLQVVQVYDNDTINDHRMAIDIYRSSIMPKKYFFMVRSEHVGDCDIEAGHATPGRSRFLRQKQYGVFLPLDALADCAFTGSDAACHVLATVGRRGDDGYRPLAAEADPRPDQPESHYKFPWNDKKNPRLRQ